MTSFLFRKMWKNKWLLLCLLAGNILLIGVASATPMYSMATVTRMIHNAMRFRQTYEGVYPAFTRLHYNFNFSHVDYKISTYMRTGEFLRHTLDTVGIPAKQTIRTYHMNDWGVTPAFARDPRATPRRVHLRAVQGAADNMNLVQGRMPSDNIVMTTVSYVRDGVMQTMQVEVIEVITAESALVRGNLLMDELLRVTSVYDQEEGDPFLYVRIVGVFEVPEESLPFWAITNINFTNALFVSESVIQNRFIPNYHFDYRITVAWYTVHDFMQMTAGGVPRYMEGIRYLRERFSGGNPVRFEENFYEMLEDHVARAAEFNITIIVLQVPMYVLLAFYIYVISRKILQLEQNDISVLKSRGASRKQIFGIYVGQGLIVGAVAFPVGIVFGVLICRLLGASGGFLYLMARAPLVVEISSQVLLFGVVAALFSFSAMIFPVIRFSKIGIVEHKRDKAGKPKKPLWQRYFLDIICLGVSVYMVYNFNIQQELGGAVNDFIDPTLFLASTMFMVGFGLFCLRVFPLIVRLVFVVCRRFMPLSLYTALLRVARSAGEEQFIMIFLVFTMAIGIFSAQAARTINLNSEHEILYLGGTDLIFRERWLNNGFLLFTGGPGGGPAAEELVYREPSFERFTNFEEVDVITRVFNENIVFEPSGGGRRGVGGDALRVMPEATLLAIEPKGFAQATWFRDDLLPIHKNYYINVLSQVPNGVLLSSNMRDMGFIVGRTINIHHIRTIPNPDPMGPDMNLPYFAGGLTIVGFVDRWPGFDPRTRQVLPDGSFMYVENSLVVGNLGHFQNIWGVFPYEIWMQTNSDTSQFFRDFIEEEDLRYTRFTDVKNMVIQGRLDPLLQGTNGVLTVNFIVTLIVCFSGFLIYWLLSIRERVLQFGIFRAMGMSMRSIIALLINEQFFITITALIIGALVGEISARLFVPLIQLAYTNQVIPLIVIMEARDYAALYTVMGAMIVICLTVLIGFISKIRIDQALKLGED